jgi:hypothetical protein
MQGQFPRNLDEKLMANGQSYEWLKFGDIKDETEIQEWQIKTEQLVQIILKIILKEEIDGKCQLGCPILAKNEYLIRYDRVGAHLHY